MLQHSAHRVGQTTVALHVVRTQNPAAERDTQGMSTEGDLASVVDLGADKLTEEALVRCRKKNWKAERNQIVAVVEQLGRHHWGFSQVETGIDHDPLTSNPGCSCLLRPDPQEVGDLAAHVAVDRMRIGDTGADPNVGRNNRCTMADSHRKEVWIGKPTDVVPDARTGTARFVED